MQHKPTTHAHILATTHTVHKPFGVTFRILVRVPDEPPFLVSTLFLSSVGLLLSSFPSFLYARELFTSFSFFSSLSLYLLLSVLGHFPAFFQSPSMIPPRQSFLPAPSQGARARAHKHTHARAAAAFLQSPSVYPSLRSLLLCRRRVGECVCARVRMFACVCVIVFLGSACLPILPRQQQRTSPGGRPGS